MKSISKLVFVFKPKENQVTIWIDEKEHGEITVFCKHFSIAICSFQFLCLM